MLHCGCGHYKKEALCPFRLQGIPRTKKGVSADIFRVLPRSRNQELRLEVYIRWLKEAREPIGCIWIKYRASKCKYALYTMIHRLLLNISTGDGILLPQLPVEGVGVE
jgi:hypothetical protein